VNLFAVIRRLFIVLVKCTIPAYLIACVKKVPSMFDISNPQKRERLLVVLTFAVLIISVVVIVPGQFAEAQKKAAKRDTYQKDIASYQQTVRNKETIERRLSAFEGQSLAFGNSEALTRYQNWLRDLATNAGIRNASSQNPVRAGGPQGIFTKYTFTLNGTARLEQIAEFLRRFHRTEYLHTIQSVQPRPAGANQPGMFNVMFKIEALSLPQVSSVHIPSSERTVTPITDEEQKMLTDIRTRAILSEYTPPQPVRENPTTPVTAPAPPPPPFDEVPYHVVSGIMDVSGKRQCWIRNLVTERLYILGEGESFMLPYLPEGATALARMQCTIKKIDAESQQIQVEMGGGLFSLKGGQNFEDVEPVEEEEEESKVMEPKNESAEDKSAPAEPAPMTKAEEPPTEPKGESMEKSGEKEEDTKTPAESNEAKN